MLIQPTPEQNEQSPEEVLANTHPFSIHCLVLLGLSPNDQDSKKPFEFYRTTLRDVIIVTFDEVLQKLVDIAALFRDPVKPEAEQAPKTSENPF